MPEATPAPAVTPTPAAGPAPARAPSDPIAEAEARLAQIRADREALVMGLPTGEDVMLGSLAGVPVGDDPRAAARINLLTDQEAQVMAELEGLRETQAYPAEAVSRARGEFMGLPVVRSFADQTSAFGRVVASAEDPSPAGDLSLIFNYMKVLDPGSVVREGEFATAQNSGGVDQRVRSLYNRLLEGERLTPEQRADFLDRANRLYEQAEEQYMSLADQYRGFAQAAGLPVEQVIPDLGFTGDRPPPRTPPPPVPDGVDPEIWAAMTDEERRAFLESGQ